jgi:hypothetical protein
MHPIISAKIADQRRLELLRTAGRNQRLRALPSAPPDGQRRARVPAAALVLRGWLVRG